ncbi:hypothetical protein llap_4600 [Limosa lapponica baueri]|uniref:SKI/SNO/DAC domain-containing protein n=1 Tax=Limosa lapponica baueri TaxID=1758121 RepID=A0A2I0UGC6_LIMLA|nr:hypothetical protein llap_4600 [Limosa lapponica baueri]
MAVSAPPVIAATSSGGGGGSAGLFRADPLYSSPAESPRLTNSLVNSFLSAGSGGAGAGGGGGGGNECKMVDLHGVKVASFLVEGQELICLPQVFDLFLKHLVGGLHTVYTKLKRLDISPVVCTVEQASSVLYILDGVRREYYSCKMDQSGTESLNICKKYIPKLLGVGQLSYLCCRIALRLYNHFLDAEFLNLVVQKTSGEGVQKAFV